MTDDNALAEFLQSFNTLTQLAQSSAQAKSPFTEPLTGFLGVDPRSASIITQEVSEYRFADWNSALDELTGADGDAQVMGVAGGDNSLHLTLPDLIEAGYNDIRSALPEYLNVATGPGESTAVYAFALRMFRWRGAPVAVLQRRAHPHVGLEKAQFQAISPAPGLARDLLDEVTRMADAHSFLRGKAFSLEFVMEEGRSVYRFLARPEVAASDVILPDGVLGTITRHVTGIAAAAEQLRAHGQHLKRGVLLYGPPGTGKTHTIKHLLTLTPDHTVVMLRGMGLTRISEAAELARRLQPSIVVLEDCDLVAEDRSMGDGTSPLLFEVLDAVDGLDADVDVTFLLTTNRVEVLEEALAQRPGRVDLAVEIPLPDEDGRRRLLELYRGAVPFSAEALDQAATESDGQTASFAKELVRRAVLSAVLADEEPGDDHLLAALHEQIGEMERLRERMGEAGEDELFDIDFDALEEYEGDEGQDD